MKGLNFSFSFFLFILICLNRRAPTEDSSLFYGKQDMI